MDVSKDPENPDKLKVSFINERYFVATDNKVPLEPEFEV